MSRLVFGDLGALAEGSDGAGEGADVDAVEFAGASSGQVAPQALLGR